MNPNISRKMALWVVIVVMAMTCANVVANAQIADSGCDAEYMDALEARAWMTGQRRVAQNASLIFKPDSVIEYGCFNEVMDVVVASPARLFSETSMFGDISSFTPNSTDSAMMAVVGTALVDYLDNNFPHRYLSGRLTEDPTAGARTPGVFECIAMSFVWNHARCMEFMDEFAREGFFDFQHYVGMDPRDMPDEFGICAPAADFAEAIQVSFNREDVNLHMLQDQNESVLDPMPYEEDPIYSATSPVNNAHVEFMISGDCATSPQIFTGLFIEREDAAGEYEEKVCVLPGCSYVEGECVAQ